MNNTGRNHYIIKHNLEALEALPNFIWNSAARKCEPPKWYRHLKKGDRWISFAYTSTDSREERLSLIVARDFSENVSESMWRCPERNMRFGSLVMRISAAI